MSSDNPTGADDQQERPRATAWLDAIPHDVGYYIAGFVDGEGSFNVPIRRARDRGLPFRVGLSFNVSQVGPDQPTWLRDVLEVGTVRGRGDGIFYYEVTSPAELEEQVFPFFDRFRLRGPKARDLEIFREITMHIRQGAHRTPEGIRRIVELRSPMNRGGKRVRSDQAIRDVLELWESSEAIRRAPH